MAEATEIDNGETPLQFEGEIGGFSGFDSVTVKSKMMGRIKIPPANKKPSIFAIHWQDPRVTIGEDKILEMTKSGKGWYPIMARCNIQDMQMVQVEKVTGGEMGKDVRKITVCIHEPNDHRNHLTETYSLHDVTNSGKP